MNIYCITDRQLSCSVLVEADSITDAVEQLCAVSHSGLHIVSMKGNRVMIQNGHTLIVTIEGGGDVEAATYPPTKPHRAYKNPLLHDVPLKDWPHDD